MAGVATFNEAEKAAARQAHRDVRDARDFLRRIQLPAATADLRKRAPVDYEDIEYLRNLLERAESNIDVVLGRRR